MNTKLNSLIIGLALLAGVHSAFAQVTNLGIAPAGGQSLIYWLKASVHVIRCKYLSVAWSVNSSRRLVR